MTTRFAGITYAGSGFVGLDRGFNFGASWDLFLIREAWYRDCDFEAEADGYGPGSGTNGDWSGIRDSSSEAKRAMLEKALNHLFPDPFPAEK